VLHASLIELAEQAPLCTDQATLRGVLTESHDLTRNALAHDTNAVEVAHWFSRLLTDALHSPAATELTDGRIQIVTGPFGRGEGMPTSPVEWLSILPKSVPYQYNQNLEKVLTETGFVLAPLPATLLPTTREDWEHRIDHALEHGDGEALGVYTDAGTWMAEKVLASRMAPPALLRNAVEHRPPAVQSLGRAGVAMWGGRKSPTPIGYMVPPSLCVGDTYRKGKRARPWIGMPASSFIPPSTSKR